MLTCRNKLCYRKHGRYNQLRLKTDDTNIKRMKYTWCIMLNCDKCNCIYYSCDECEKNNQMNEVLLQSELSIHHRKHTLMAKRSVERKIESSNQCILRNSNKKQKVSNHNGQKIYKETISHGMHNMHCLYEFIIHVLRSLSQTVDKTADARITN